MKAPIIPDDWSQAFASLVMDDWTAALNVGAECDDWVQIQGGADENVTPSTQPGAVR